MKIRNIILSLATLFAFYACNDEASPVLDIPEPIVLEELAMSSITFTDENIEDLVLGLEWTAAKPELNVITDYVIQIDKAGNNFNNAKILASTNELSYELKGADINIFLIKNFGHKPLTTQGYEIRVLSRVTGKDKITEVLSQTASNREPLEVVTMNTEKPVLYVIGDALLGWTNTRDEIGNELQVLFANNSQLKDPTYTYTAFFKGGAGKGLRFPTEAGDWTYAYGYENNSLVFGIENAMPAPPTDGVYTLKVDTKNLTASFEPYIGTAVEQTSVGIIGDAAKGWGDNDDIIMTKVAKYVWVAKNVTLKAGGIKFREGGKWDTQWGGTDKQELPFDINGGDNINIGIAGSYYIALNTLTGHHVIIPMDDLP